MWPSPIWARCAKACSASSHGRCVSAAAAFRGGWDSSRRSRNSRPKSVETTDLRSSLVYEIRVFVRDPGRRAAPGDAGHACTSCAMTRRTSASATPGAFARWRVSDARRPASPAVVAQRPAQSCSCARASAGGAALDGVSLEARARRTDGAGGAGRRRQDHADAAGRGTAARRRRARSTVLGIDVGSGPAAGAGPHQLHAAAVRAVRGSDRRRRTWICTPTCTACSRRAARAALSATHGDDRAGPVHRRASPASCRAA